MPQPEIDCPCGAKIAVNLWDAGIDKACPRCGAVVSVPSLEVLKRLAGDKHPLLSNWQKLIVAIEDREEPFDGTVCRGCHSSSPDYEVPVELVTLRERHIADDSPIRVSGLGVKVGASAGIEEWQQLTIPLQLCASCHHEFQRSFYWKNIGRCILSTLGIVVVSVVFFTALLLVAPIGIFGLPIVVFVMFIILRRAHRRKKDWRFSPWLDNFPVIVSVLSQESEYKLFKKESVPLK